MGNPVRLFAQDQQLVNRFQELCEGFEPTVKPARAALSFQVTWNADSQWRVFHDSCQISAPQTRDGALSALVGAMNRVILEGATDLSIHAGVVQHGDLIVAFPAESGQGKTTLTSALVRHGFEYLSDEALVIGEGGEVIPYPKPIALSAWSCTALGLEPTSDETLFAASDLESVTGGGGRLTDIVVAEYGHERLTLQPAPASLAMSTLLSNAFNHYKDPEQAFQTAAHIAGTTRTWTLLYDEPLQAADQLASTLL